MNDNDNPYISLIEGMRVEGAANNPVPFMIGVVNSVSPLIVQVGEIEFDEEDLLINDSLLSGNKQKVKINASSVSGNVVTEHGGNLNSFNMSSGDLEILDDVFKKGDRVVALISQDQQQIVIICKVR